ncbi:MAG: glycoside hydrolase family 95 protein [Phycisphaerales bacterium]|nr:glycoside hydrolase family 95 protein [Phycisphaerales bacterium]
MGAACALACVIACTVAPVHAHHPSDPQAKAQSPQPSSAIPPSHDAPPEGLVLWYRQPAREWNEALPVGNGRLGAMVFGGVARERIQLNESSVWEGSATMLEPKECATWVPLVREAWFAGRIAEAQRLAQQHMLDQETDRSYQTLGDLIIESIEPSDAGDYRRGLDLAAGMAMASWRSRRVTHTRTVFASRAFDCIVVRLDADAPESVSCGISLSRAPSCESCPLAIESSVAPGTGIIRMRGRTEPSADAGVTFGCDVTVEVEGGKVRDKGGGRLGIFAADSVTILISAATDFPFANAARGAAPGTFDLDRALRAGTASAPRDFPSMVRAHESAWRAQFGRFAIELGPADRRRESMPTDQRLAALRDSLGSVPLSQPLDPSLVALAVQYARALMIGSSQPGTLPANLQGLWSEHLKAPWNADYHTNINLQMNYWFAEQANLAECTGPLMDFIGRVAGRGALTARRAWDCGGWCAHHASTAWANTAPTGAAVWGLWPMGGAWVVRHAHERWLHGGDGDFLRGRAFPLTLGAARFVMDWLVTDPATGLLVAGPSASPENEFTLPDGTRASVGMGNAMDQQIAHDLLSNLIEQADAIGGDAASHLDVMRARATLAKLAPTSIAPDGRIREWSRDFAEAEPGHRHMSHLYALHPGAQITPKGTPELATAARRTIEARLAAGGGHTGWSRAWLICLYARLGDGNEAERQLRLLLGHSTLPNLLGTHPPFQIDGTFGLAEGVLQMLAQSHRTEGSGADRVRIIELLPALPDAWSEGRIRGMRLRGGVEIDFSWTAGQVTDAVVRTTGREALRVDLGGRGSIAAMARDGADITVGADAAGAPRRSIDLPRHDGSPVTWSLRCAPATPRQD